MDFKLTSEQTEAMREKIAKDRDEKLEDISDNDISETLDELISEFAGC